MAFAAFSEDGEGMVIEHPGDGDPLPGASGLAGVIADLERILAGPEGE